MKIFILKVNILMILWQYDATNNV